MLIQMLVKVGALATTAFPFVLAYSVSLSTQQTSSDDPCVLDSKQLDVLKEVGNLLRAQQFASAADIVACNYNMTLGDIFRLGDT
jgi:hypothetical protein